MTGDDDADKAFGDHERRLKVLLITDFYRPYLGGVEQHVRSLGAALAAMGHDVTVATLTGPGLADFELDGAVRVHRLRSTTQRLRFLFSSAARPWAPPIPDPAVVVQLRRLIASVRPDVVHGHDWLLRSFLPLRRWSARRFGTQFVTTLHYYTLSCAKKNLMISAGAAAGSTEQPCPGPALVRCLRCASRHYGTVIGTVTAAGNVLGARAERRGAQAVVAVSEATRRGNGLHDAAGPVHVIPNFLPARPARPAPRAGADNADNSDDGEVAALVAQLPATEFILFVGDLRPMKGLDVLLDAYARTATTVPLVLIGKRWPDTPHVVPPGVQVFERWPNTAVTVAWQRSTIAVVPSVWAEPFGIVVIEAMAGGTPVVGSRAGGIPEIVEHGVTGLLVEPGDAAQLAAALTALLDDPARRDAMGAAARVRADAYTAAAVVPTIVELYRSAGTPARRPRTTSE